MGLRIIRALDPIAVENIIMCIYGPPGVCKSSFGYSAEAPVLLDFDKGAHRAVGRKDTIPVDTWDDVAGITESDLAPYKTIVVDTAGRALDRLSAHIIASDAKMGRGGALTLQGYGRLKVDFVRWLNYLRGFRKDIMLLAHSSEDKNGDDTVERIDAQGSSKGEIYKVADAMGKISIVGGKRKLTFSPTETSFGKNPAQFGILDIPHYDENDHFAADIIEAIKAKLNDFAELQRKRQEMLVPWMEDVAGADTPEAITELSVRYKEADRSLHDTLRKSILAKAESMGLEFDKASSAFVAKVGAA